MKKVLALVLALVMVLALVPVAFAATYTVTYDNYKVVATVVSANNVGKENTDPTQIDDPDFKWDDVKADASGAAPALEIKLPYKQIDTQAAAGIWASASDLKIALSVQNFGGKTNVFSTTNALIDAKIKNVKINGTEYTEFGDDKTVSFDTANNALSFNMGDVSSLDKTYEYVIEITGEGEAADWYEKMNFTVKFTNIDKPVYDLKVAAIDNATLKDGVWFIDSPMDCTPEGTTIDTDADPIENPAAKADHLYQKIQKLVFDLRKNDGSKFAETAYVSVAEDNYTVADTNSKLTSESKTPVYDAKAVITAIDTKYTFAIRVETQYALYETKINVKARDNVIAVDPKGVNFDKDEYTIAVNQVFFPGYTYIVDPLKDIVGSIALEQTAYGEKNIVDIDVRDGKAALIGLKEGTAYVKLSYTHDLTDGVTAATYTDTAKVIVKGTTAVQPDENFVVTVASGSCLYKRAAASTSSANLGKLQNGTVIKVAEIKDGWAKVIADDFTNYYVNATYITRQGTKVNNGTGVVIARCLNVRAGAGTDTAVIGHLYRNAKIDIAEIVADGAWGKITYQGNTAYVAMAYIQ